MRIEEHELDMALEGLMDANTVYQLLSSLSRVCGEKAEWVRGGGSHGEPSAYLAQQWQKLAKGLDKLSSLAAGL